MERGVGERGERVREKGKKERESLRGSFLISSLARPEDVAFCQLSALACRKSGGVFAYYRSPVVILFHFIA